MLLVSLEQDGATGSAQSRCKFQNTTILESVTLLHKRAAIEAIKGGAGRGMAPLTLSHLHLLWLAWQLRVRITKCFHWAMQGANLETFQIVFKNVDIRVQSDLKDIKLVQKWNGTLLQFLCLTHVFENILMRLVDTLVKLRQ